MIEITAKLITLLASSFLICLALASFVFPGRAALFLNSFASTKKAHFTEMIIRLFVGVALIFASKDMALSEFHYLLGLVLVISSVVLIFVPWQYHQKFANIVVPPFTKRVWIFGLLALPLGLEIVIALVMGANA